MWSKSKYKYEVLTSEILLNDTLKQKKPVKLN